MNKIIKHSIMILISLCAATCLATPLSSPVFGLEDTAPSQGSSSHVAEYQESKDPQTGKHSKEFTFADGSVFFITRFDNNRYQSPDDPATGITSDGDLNIEKLYLQGNDIRIRIQNYANRNNPYWMSVADLDDIPKATLFIETTEEKMILSIPALYDRDFSHNTVTALKDKEQSVQIKRIATGYAIYLSFEKVPSSYGEFWYYKTKKSLFPTWTEDAQKTMLRQDLHNTRRFCIDGYYFQTYNTYSPYNANGYFRHAANYTGAQLMEYDLSAPTRNLGYAMTKLCLSNQNEMGYWHTGPMSTILNKDYGIAYDFYDTRFNADFARSLVIGHQKFNDEEMLDSAKKYANFLVGYVDSLAYRVNGPVAQGYLLPDYWSSSQKTKPYVSLNHHLSELNFLLMIYKVTGNAHYGNAADKLLQGVKNTYKEWVMPDSNLKYALLDGASSNLLVDYPYLTYNDLYLTRELLQTMGKGYTEIQYLMDAKKAWMDANGVTGYYK